MSGAVNGSSTGADALVHLLKEKEQASAAHQGRIWNGELARAPGSEVERITQAHRDAQAARDRAIDSLIDAHAAAKGKK